MKQDPNLQKIQEKMHPGRITNGGFLGEDTRSLSAIISEDRETLEGLGISNEMIAEKMRYFTGKARSGFGSPVTVDDFYLVSVDEHRGKVPCPFSDNFWAAKVNTTITNLLTSETLTWSDLNIHMIEKHGFFEGKGAMFRVDPAKAVVVLGIMKQEG